MVEETTYSAESHTQAAADTPPGEILSRLSRANREAVIVFRAADGLILEVNESWERATGHSRAEAVGRRRGDLNLWADPADPEKLAALVREQGSVSDYTFTFLHKSGEARRAVLSAEALTFRGEQCVLAVGHDVTERLRAAERQSAILDALPAHISLLDAQGRVVAVNEAWRRFASANAFHGSDFGVGSNYLEVTERSRGDCEAEARRAARGVRAVLAREVPQFEMEYPCHSPDEKLWFRLMATPLDDGAGGVVAMHVNVTERRRAEEQLRRSEAGLANAQRIAHLGNWEWDIARNELSWSDEVYRIFGLAKAEARADYEMFIRGVHPDDRRRVQEAVDAAVSGGATYDIEHRVVRPDGTERIVHELGEVSFDESGEPLTMTGTVQDVSERRRVEGEIRRLHSIALAVNEAATVGGAVEAALRSVCEGHGWACGEAWLPDGEGARLEYSGAWHGDEELYGEFRRAGEGLRLAPGEGLPGRAWEEKSPVWMCEGDDGRAFCRAETAARLGLAGGVAIPVVSDDEVVAVLALFDAEPRDDDERLIKFVSAVAAHLGTAIRRMRAEEALHAADQRAVNEYKRLLERVADLARHLGAARELPTIFGALRDFALASVPCSALIISIYDAGREASQPVYFWYQGGEVDVAGIGPARVGLGPTGRAISSNSVVISNDYLAALGDRPADVRLGFDRDARPPRSATIAPMAVMGRVIGVVEAQSYDLGAFDEGHAAAMRMAANLAANAVENVRLIEQERLTAEQFRQAQKMEAVGRLAGGVAHDFNNMLTAINGYSDLVLRKLSENDPLRANIGEIKKAGERAANLTRQLLAFSRKQVLQPKVLDLNAIISDMETMLPRLIGEDIEVLTILGPDLGRVRADPGQIEQVIVNLVVNARDAMPGGGDLTVETANVVVDEAFARAHRGIAPGPYVMLAVKDTGTGMDEETQAKIFEPFFTTKEVGKGTGLGLSTVYGIVKQSGGSIYVTSEPGRGATFRVYLPLIEAEGVDRPEGAATAKELPRGREVVLIVEDEELVRGIAVTTLEMAGYEVLVASNGGEALLLCEQRAGRIDLMVTDVVMPQMGGRVLADRLAALRPDMKVLFMSGYTEDSVVRHGVLEENTDFIEKPFSPTALARKVREVLDG